VLVDKKNKKILGAYILGPRATELIVTFAVAISNNLTTFQLKDTVFAHLTLSECIREAVE
jgi:dihydrolipoamide dehydrogenase